MKRKHIILSVLIFIVSLSLLVYFYFLPRYIVSTISEYPPYTFEKILSSKEMRTDYGIGDHSAPEDYGFSSEEVTFYALYDSLPLNAWWIQNNNKSQKTIILVHGRTSNRLKPLKYLSLIKELGLDTAYNVFIPDMRNSGKSPAAITRMGDKFTEDLAGAIHFLQNDMNQDTVVLYGFSMGAMAIMNLNGRQDTKDSLKNWHTHISMVILDSPLSNVYATTLAESQKIGVPDFMFNKGFDAFDEKTNGWAKHMNMHELMANADYPLLVMQSETDKTTPHPIFIKEWEQLQTKAPKKVIYFNGPNHVRIFQDSTCHKQYINEVKSFFEKHTLIKQSIHQNDSTTAALPHGN